MVGFCFLSNPFVSVQLCLYDVFGFRLKTVYGMFLESFLRSSRVRHYVPCVLPIHYFFNPKYESVSFYAENHLKRASRAFSFVRNGKVSRFRISGDSLESEGTKFPLNHQNFPFEYGRLAAGHLNIWQNMIFFNHNNTNESAVVFQFCLQVVVVNGQSVNKLGGKYGYPLYCYDNIIYYNNRVNHFHKFSESKFTKRKGFNNFFLITKIKLY